MAKFKLSPKDWLIEEKGFYPYKQGIYESLFTLGNGYLGVRGSLEENPECSYRGVYIAGIFDKSESYVREVVKDPGWCDFSVWLNDEKFSVDTCKVLLHKRTLDLKTGILYRVTRFRNRRGKILKLETRRVVFAHQVRGAALDVTVTPENFSGVIKISSGLNGDVSNQGYFSQERIKHLNLTNMRRTGNDHIYLEMKTRDSNIKIAMASSTQFDNPSDGAVTVNRIYGEKFAQEITFNADKKKSYHFIKWVTIFTSREGYERQIEAATADLLHDMAYDGIDYHLKRHLEVKEREWERADIKIVGDKKAQLGIRFNLYHLMIAKPHHDPTVSVGARFLTSEGYKGHTFWDTEIFILPFYIFNFPEDARNLLMYRYYTLKGALANARLLGYKGAKVAWESADTGEETTPNCGLRADGTVDKIFTGDEEHHIVSDVVYGIYKFVEATGDADFLYKFGAEMVFQTARFWLSRVEKRRDRYEIRKVIGPDEFHEHVDNNAFTNYLVKWHLAYAGSIYKEMKKLAPEQLKVLMEKIKLKADEIEKMEAVSKTIHFPYDQKSELIEQFEGYFTLDDHKVTQFDKHGMPRYPRGINGSNVHRTRLLKQADVVLLMYLFLDRFSSELKKKNYKYYEARTMHKSSLSPCSYALMGLEIGDHKKAYNYFMKTSYIDLLNLSRNTSEGIHAAAMGGAWMTAIQGFGGMKVRRGDLCFDPWLPGKWRELNYNLTWQGSLMNVKVTRKSIILKLLSGKSMDIKVYGKPVRLKLRKPAKIKLIPGVY
ncbi:MAG: glycosyl hydrolase family 65 protein [Candidatus Margulisiibacteriota bacterium]|nr:glycosyl hydrolase family 65 protein [Candidatus Margulisiibacteriota bacterium]